MKVSKELVARIRSGMASEQELREAGRENVLAIKSDGEAMHFRFSIKRRPSSLNEEARTVEHVASTEDQDRMGDRIAVRGWDLGNWQRNPVVLFDHDQGSLPVGRGLKARKGNEDGIGPALLITTRFHEAEKNPQAELIYRMVADGDLPAGSVGFNPYEIVRPKSEDETKELGLGEFGVYFKRQELLEWSIVTVPAHAGALTKKLDQYAKDGAYDSAVIDAVLRALTGKEPEQRVFAVPDLSCVVVDELPAERGGGDAWDAYVRDAIPAMARRLDRELSSGMVATTPPIPRAATIDEIRAAIREESPGVEASARLIRSIVRDEITAALSAAAKSKVPPTATPAGSGDCVEPTKDSNPETKGADLYEGLLNGLRAGASANK